VLQASLTSYGQFALNLHALVKAGGG
jgi:hypothetical protein